MDRRILKYNVAAALFSAAFLFGNNPIDAYTYSNVISDLDKIIEDKDDLTVTDNSKITIATKNFNPQKRNEKQIKQVSDELQIRYGIQPGMEATSDPVVMITGIPSKMTDLMYDQFKKIFSSADHSHMNSNDLIEGIKNFNTAYKSSITTKFDESYRYGDCYLAYDINNVLIFKNNEIQEKGGQQRRGGGIASFKIEKNNDKTFYYETTVIIDNASITVSNKSTFSSKGNVQTSKAINVTGDSFLKAAGTIIGGNVYSDKAIISTTNDQGESIITPGNITATGALKSDTYIGAWSGAVSGKTVYSGGNVVSANSIKAGGLAKGKVLNVSAINATSASITGNQSISGVFTTTGQAKLNGGAVLGNKKISSLSAGTLSATSTDAVNGSQLNTIKQKLATAGKTYSAGADVAITAANAISVAKNGAIDKGNTGIVTGGTVYKITNALNQSLDSLKASVSSHQSTLTTLFQGLSDLKSSVTNINSSVASATKNLSAQLTNRLQSDLGNLSNDGKNVIRNMVSSTLKSMNSMSIEGDI